MGSLRSEKRVISYSPLPSQCRFHASEARFKGFSGPVGSGKSAALCMEVIRLAWQNSGRHGLLAAPTYSMLRDATQVALFAALDAAEIEYAHNKSEGSIKLEGSSTTILLRSLDEPERLRGTNLAWFGVDELSYAKEEAWLRLEARLRDPQASRLCGFAVWTPKGHDWVYKRFIKKRIEGYDCILAKPFENRYLLDKTPDYYQRLESSYDPKFYAQEVLGDYVNATADRAYYCFNQAVHVVKHAYRPELPLLWALDFNVTPMTSVIAQQDGEYLKVIDEIVLERATTEQAAQEFCNRYGRHAAGLQIYGDASGKNMHSTGQSDYGALQQTLHRTGVRPVMMKVPNANPSVINRVHKVNALLTSADGEVRLEIDPKCRNLIKDLDEVVFLQNSMVLDKLRDPMRTHASDALGYLAWALYGNKSNAGERNQPLF